jgi:hypothetical protein
VKKGGGEMDYFLLQIAPNDVKLCFFDKRIFFLKTLDTFHPNIVFDKRKVSKVLRKKILLSKKHNFTSFGAI